MRLLVLSAYNVLRLLTWPVWALWWRLRRSSTRWVALQLRGSLDELPRPQKRWQRLISGMRAPRRSVYELRRLCDRIAADPRAQGLLLRVEPLEAGYATLASARRELERLRAAGKQVVCYLPAEASQRELYLASAADRVLAMPHAGFSVLGPSAARTYFAPLLERLGVQVLVTAEGRFKTAADPFVRAAMSEPEREQLGAIVRVLYDTLAAAFRRSRAEQPRSPGPEASVERVFEAGLFGAQRAQELGLVDQTAFDDELPTCVGLNQGEQLVAHDRYYRRAAPRPAALRSLRQRKKVAIVRLLGAISERGGAGAGAGIDLHGTTAVLRRLAELEQVAGVVLYVDSPGGSAVVSELLHREIVQLDAKKPVVTWMGNVAASGGYYLASATRAIVAQPATLTGSIGVVSIRPVIERVLEQLQMRREQVSLTPYADLNALTRAPSDAEVALLRAETARFYERFLEVVASGRKRSRDEVYALAQGRVWTGHDAHKNGLVDVLGGYYEARAALAALLGSAAALLDPEPMFVSPQRREVPSLPKLTAPRDAALAAIAALVQKRTEGAHAVATRFDEALGIGALHDLWTLAESGERVFAYGLGLPLLC